MSDIKSGNKGPKPLFPQSPAVQPQRTPVHSTDPKPLNLKPSIVAAGPKPLNITPSVAAIVKQPKSVTPAVLFKDQAITEEYVDPIYRMNPLCDGLSNKDVGRVKSIVQKCNLTDTEYVLNYADELRSEFTQLVDAIILETNAGQLAAVNTNLARVIQYVKEMDAQLANITNPTPPKSKGLGSKIASALMGNGWDDTPEPILTVMQVVNEFHNYMKAIDTSVMELVKGVDSLVLYVDKLDNMFKNNKDNFVWLQLYIVAGKIIVQEHRNTKIPKLKASVKQDDPFALQEVLYLEDCVLRFDRKVSELEKVAHSVLLNAPQIRMMQSNSKDTAERIKQTAHYLIPTWKTHCLTLINMLQSTNATNLIDAVNNPSFMGKKQIIADIQRSNKEIQTTFV